MKECLTRAVLAMTLLCSLSACQTASKVNPTSKPTKSSDLELTKPVEIKWVGEPGRIEKMKYYSHSSTRTFENQSIRHQREEIVEFTVQSKVVSSDRVAGLTAYEVTTLEKDGPVNLRDMAFPEVGEVLPLVVSEKAMVVSAGNYPKNSIFFVPPLSLPSRAVSVGDTWTMEHSWVSLNNGLKLELSLVTILKRVIQCPDGGACFELEVSGDVTLPDMKSGQTSSHLDSKIFGRLLFSEPHASIIWSDVRNRESFLSEGMRVEVLSCIQSQLEEPLSSALKKNGSVVCNPNESAPPDLSI